MQKKIIALAIASAMTVPALAYAEVSISGLASVSIDMTKTGATTNSQSNNVLQSNNSRVVMKGSEDLGNGLSAMFFLDSRFNLDDGTIGANATSANLFGGNAYVGVKSGDLGTLMLGRNDTPYKVSTRGLDVFIDVAGDNRASNGSSIAGLLGTHDVRSNNTIIYASPNMSGFSVMAGSVFGAETPNTTTANKKGSALSLAGMYTMDNIYATLAYDSKKLGDAATGDLSGSLTTVDNESKAFKLGGSYKMDTFTVNAVIEKLTDKQATGASAGDTTSTNLYLAGKFAVSGTDAVRLAYTRKGTQTAPVTGDAKNDATQIAIGYVHDMSKVTSVYATYVKTDANNAAGTAADPSVLSFGMKHSF